MGVAPVGDGESARVAASAAAVIVAAGTDVAVGTPVVAAATPPVATDTATDIPVPPSAFSTAAPPATPSHVYPIGASFQIVNTSFGIHLNIHHNHILKLRHIFIRIHQWALSHRPRNFEVWRLAFPNATGIDARLFRDKETFPGFVIFEWNYIDGGSGGGGDLDEAAIHVHLPIVTFIKPSPSEKDFLCSFDIGREYGG